MVDIWLSMLIFFLRTFIIGNDIAGYSLFHLLIAIWWVFVDHLIFNCCQILHHHHRFLSSSSSSSSLFASASSSLFSSSSFSSSSSSSSCLSCLRFDSHPRQRHVLFDSKVTLLCWIILYILGLCCALVFVLLQWVSILASLLVSTPCSLSSALGWLSLPISVLPPSTACVEESLRWKLPLLFCPASLFFQITHPYCTSACRRSWWKHRRNNWDIPGEGWYRWPRSLPDDA